MPQFVKGKSLLSVEFVARDSPTEDGGDRDYAWELTTTADGDRKTHRRFARDADAFRAFHGIVRDCQAEGYLLAVEGQLVAPGHADLSPEDRVALREWIARQSRLEKVDLHDRRAD